MHSTFASCGLGLEYSLVGSLLFIMYLRVASIDRAHEGVLRHDANDIRELVDIELGSNTRQR